MRPSYVCQAERQQEQAVCFFAQFCHADCDKRNDDQRDHKGQEGGKQRRECRKCADDGDKASRISDTQPPAGQTDDGAGR